MFCKPFLFFFNSKKCLVNQAKVKQLFCSYTFIHILTYRHKNRNRRAYIEQGRRERFSHQVNTPYPYPTYFKFPFPLLQVSHALGLSNTCKTFQKKKPPFFKPKQTIKLYQNLTLIASSSSHSFMPIVYIGID